MTDDGQETSIVMWPYSLCLRASLGYGGVLNELGAMLHFSIRIVELV